jgi:acetyl/propionyl-CoA carboxylase alpha subunit
MFERLLVANRGEIARRVIRTARRLSIHTVAVCSDVDASAPFAREADEHHVIGEAPPKDSYLDVAKILDVAKRARVDAIHPGYGFLSENADFAEAVAAAGIRFVGPSPDTIRKVGGKLDARAIAERARVPVVPGSGAIGSVEAARSYAEEIGFPVLIKAAAGGGGIGMTTVESPEKVDRAFADAQKKGRTFFGDDTVYIEKLIESPAHLEVQVLGDGEGKVWVLGDRDCTVQRRHQKVIEETPSPRLDDATRQQMLSAAARLAEAAGYVNAGTVEMIHAGAGPDAGRFYFLEVNSRLQVEHPVTEMVTGVDLVEEQLRVAAGLGVTDGVRRPVFRGHAIEARVCAENPSKRFFPSPGQLGRVNFHEADHVRIDSGVESGSRVPPNYDSLLAKVVAWGEDRAEAIQRLSEALQKSEIQGVTTNVSALVDALGSEGFRSGRHDTGLLARLGYES